MANGITNPWFGISMALVGVIGGYVLAQGVPLPSSPAPSAPLQAAVQPTAAPTPPPPPPSNTPATPDDDITMGDPDALVTLIEFSDFQCPFCRRFWSEALPQIKAQYIDTGKVKFVYRDFPLSFHPGAEPAARAMECAREQSDELAWALHDTIFAKQAEQGQGTIQFTADDVKTWAGDVSGLNVSALTSCLDSNKYSDEVGSDIADGSAAGINGTPGFWVLGPDDQAQIISGAQPYTAFQAVFDRFLQ